MPNGPNRPELLRNGENLRASPAGLIPIPMQAKVASIVVVFAALVAVGFLSIKGLAPAAVSFQQIAPQALLGTLTWMFAVAVFLERAVEVIVMVLRDAEADVRVGVVAAEQGRLDEAGKAVPTTPLNLDALHAAQESLSVFRAETKEIALCVSFVLGIAVSLAGIRAFASIVNAVPGENWLFSTVDVLVTGAVLAGGSEGVHQMVNVLSNFLESLADHAKK